MMKGKQVKEQQVVARWHQQKGAPADYEMHLLSLQKSFLAYKLNIFLLNRYALRIQHWFFEKRHPKGTHEHKKAENRATEVKTEV